jgi:hypothetical protein
MGAQIPGARSPWRQTFVRLRLMLVIIFFNCSWVDTRWQFNSTHLHTNSTQNTENGAYIIKSQNWELRAVPRLCELYPGICLITEEKLVGPQNATCFCLTLLVLLRAPLV